MLQGEWKNAGIPPVEYERLAGVELVKNRIYMSSILGGDAVVLHPFVVYDKDILPFIQGTGAEKSEGAGMLRKIMQYQNLS